MEDLENERDLLVTQLKAFNFKPVNAEAMLPSGATSWDRISEELSTCHLFILISGTRYGWIPSSGPLASEGVSVTHGEYLAARSLQLPILPFFKTLKYTSSPLNGDSEKRDKFRREVAEWDTGQFRSEFTTARDLAEKAAAAVTRMLSDHFQREQIARRRTISPSTTEPAAAPEPLSSLPYKFVHAVREQKAVFWSGSGISLKAGLPSGALLGADFARTIAAELRRPYSVPIVGSGLASVATDLELSVGRTALIERVSELLELPGGVSPTLEHRRAVKLFPRIVTTNYDQLFERAVLEGTSRAVIIGPAMSSLPSSFIWKIHGSTSLPDSIVLSEKDISKFETYSDQIIARLRAVFMNSVVLVGETTLRDPSIYRLFRALKGSYEGYWCVPFQDPVATKRAEDLGLSPIFASLSEILRVLSADLQ